MGTLALATYDREFLARSFIWLSDPEIKKMVMVSDVDPEKQEVFFNSLPQREDYFIFGLILDGIRIGVAGLKKVNKDKQHGEYWGYIGEKAYWGKGIGQDIMKEIERFAFSIGLNKLYLNVAQDNIIAVKAYLKFGFSCVSNENGVICMEKVVNG